MLEGSEVELARSQGRISVPGLLGGSEVSADAFDFRLVLLPGTARDIKFASLHTDNGSRMISLLFLSRRTRWMSKASADIVPGSPMGGR